MRIKMLRHKGYIVLGLFIFLVGCTHTVWQYTQKGGWKFSLNMPVDALKVAPKIFHSLSFHNSSVYFSGLDNNTYAITGQSGKLIWHHEAQSYSLYAPEFDQTNQLFSTNFDGNLYAINTNTGDEIWRFTTPDRTKIDTEPIIAGTDVLYGSRNGTLYAVDKNQGTLHWEYKTKPIDKSHYKDGEAIFHFGLFSKDKENVYLNSATEQKLIAIDVLTGKKKWSIDLEHYYFNKPEVNEKTVGIRNSPTTYKLIDKVSGETVNDMQITDGFFYVAKHCMYTITSDARVTCTNPDTGKLSWIFSNVYSLPTNITEIRSDIVAIISLNVNATVVTTVDIRTGKELWSHSFPYNQQFTFLSSNSRVTLIGQHIQCSLSFSGDIIWCTNNFLKESKSFLTKQGVYTLSKSGSDIYIQYINLINGKLKWTYTSRDVNTDTVKEYQGDLYFLDKRNNNLVKLNASFPKEKLLDSDLINNSVSNTLLWNVYPILQYIQVSLKKNILLVEQPPQFIPKNGIFEMTVKTNKPLWKENQMNTSYILKLVSPAGTEHTIQGFYYDLKTWKFRFSPTITGMWRWSFAPASTAKINRSTGSFLVSDSENQGFLSLSKINPKYFANDTGNIFLPIGIQNCVNDLHHDGNPLDSWPLDDEVQGSDVASEYRTTSMQNYISSYAKSGFNLYRWGAGNCTFTLWNFGQANSSGPQTNEGILLDTMLTELRKNNFHIWLSLLSFDLPYSSSLSFEEQKAILKQYMDYMVARYAGLVDVWELANEIKLSDSLIQYMAQYIRSIDPYKHPITTSWERPDLHDIEITSFHWYSGECNEYCDQDLEREVSKFAKYKKPLVFSEQGNNFVNWDPSSSVRFRLRLWLGFFRQSFSIFWNMPSVYFENRTGPSNIYIGPVERSYASVFSRLTKSMGDNIQNVEITSVGRQFKPFAVSSSDKIYGYIYTKIFDAEKSSTSISFPIDTDGVIQWISPETGEILSQQHVLKGKITVPTPKFTTDIIFIFTK